MKKYIVSLILSILVVLIFGWALYGVFVVGDKVKSSKSKAFFDSLGTAMIAYEIELGHRLTYSDLPNLVNMLEGDNSKGAFIYQFDPKNIDELGVIRDSFGNGVIMAIEQDCFVFLSYGPDRVSSAHRIDSDDIVHRVCRSE
ncbi:MAG: hypothetical protein MK080_03885 [Opitutales bacterium]|nr:hypothetical protein [Opitutales bacterium]NRA25778.1 hypothetical protein [Opitutales bacterium]